MNQTLENSKKPSLGLILDLLARIRATNFFPSKI